MTKGIKNFKANYNGESIRPGEVMVPFEYTELDAKNCTNAECIKTVTQGGRRFKVIYKAVPQEWAKKGTSALSLIQNEALGHYAKSNSVSRDALLEAYELELDMVPSAEDIYMDREEKEEQINTFVKLVYTLIDRSAKIGYAVLLVYTGIRGREFYQKMKLSHDPANVIRKKAEDILFLGLANFDMRRIRCYRSRYDAEYRAEAYKLLDGIVRVYRESVE